MPKKVFWPVALIVMGLVLLGQGMGYFPAGFWHLWPLILIVVGLGGLITSDRDAWMYNPKKSTTTPKAKPVASKPTKVKAKARSKK